MRTVALSEIADQIRGVSYGKADVVDRPLEGFLPVLRANNITEEGLTLSDLVFVRSDKVGDRQRIRAGDIIIAASSGSISVVGKSAQAQADLEAGFGAFCKVVRPSGRVNHRYLGHFFRTPDYRRKMSALAEGANINNLKNEHIDKLEIPLPPLDEQRRIAAILDQADALRRKRRGALDRLNQLGRAIFMEMFGDPASNPKGWTKVPLSECCAEPDDIRCGPFGTQLLRQEFQKTGVPLWGIKQVNKAFSIPTNEYVTPKKAKELSKYDIVENDIVMTRKGTIGNCAVYPEGFPPGVMHSDLLRVRIDQKRSSPKFISDQLHYSIDVERQIELISGGAIMQGINVGKLKKIAVLFPPLKLQAAYASNISQLELNISHMNMWNCRCEALIAAIQHRAFRGEL